MSFPFPSLASDLQHWLVLHTLHSAVLENIHTYPTKGTWIDNFWNYTSYVSIVTTRPDISYVLKVIINKWECINKSIALWCIFNADFIHQISSRFFVNFLFIQMVKKLNKNLFGVQTWRPTIICKFCWTMTDCLQCVSQDFWQTVPKFIWNSRSSLRTRQFY